MNRVMVVTDNLNQAKNLDFVITVQSWPKLEELISEPEDNFRERKITGRDVPVLWKEYLETGSDNVLGRIMSHCLSDMLSSMFIINFSKSVL